MNRHILLVDDEISIYKGEWDLLSDYGYKITIISDVENALKALNAQRFDMLLMNMAGSGMQKLKLLKAAKNIDAGISVMIASAEMADASVAHALKAGAVDYLEEPIKAGSALRAINRVFEERQLTHEMSPSQDEVQEHGFRGIITKSPKMLRILELIEKLSDVHSTVLITGETGVGKELVARAIHFTGSRRKMPFVAINCGALTETLLESELFGHEKGSFTGAFKLKQGKFESAHKGTLFLDEIGDVPPSMQVKLLRALQERKVERVGGTHPINVDVRVISATNQNIKEKVNSHDFRIDLYYRLNVVPIHVPPLRERPEDIPLLVQLSIDRLNNSQNCNIGGVTARALRQLMDYPWPGNVRELENVVERTYITHDCTKCGDRHVIDRFSFPQASENVNSLQVREASEVVNVDIPFDVARDRVLKEFERAYLAEALKRCDGNVSQTARKAGINPRTLWRKIKEHHLDRMSFTGKE